MFNLDNITSKIGNKKWPYRMFIIGSAGSGKTNALLNLIQKIIAILLKRFICTLKT